VSVVLSANFQTVPTGLTENVEATWATAVALPTATNTVPYTAQVIGKLKFVTTQALPTGYEALGSTGVVQFGNKTTSPGKVQVLQVQGPFKLTVVHAPSSAGDATRKLRVDIGGTQQYYDGDGYPKTAVINYAGTGKVDIDAYGWFDASVAASPSQGAGVRIYDLKIEQ